MGNSQSEYMNDNEELEQQKQAATQQKSNAEQKIAQMAQQEGFRDVSVLTSHLPRVNPLVNFTVAQHTGYVSPPTRGQTKDPRGLPKSVEQNPITEVPGFLQPSGRAESYLDERDIASLQGPRQISFV